jgi:cyclophilin family peptidyl-prolyl cis-trans isomerase
MANRGGTTTNSSQWFFNTSDNTAGPWAPGQYTTFGAVLDAESQDTLNALVALPTTLDQAYPLANQGSANTNVPVRSIAAINARQAFSPKDDLIIVNRVAALFDVAATPGASRSIATVAAVASTAPSAVPSPTPAAASASKASAFSALVVDRKHSVLDDTAE